MNQVLQQQQEARMTRSRQLCAERVLWINDKTVGGGAGKLYRTAARVLEERGAVVAPFFGLFLPGEVPLAYLDCQPQPIGDKDYAGFLRRRIGDGGLLSQLRKMRAAFSPTAVVVQNCHKYIGPEVILEAKSWNVPVILLVNDYGVYCANCYGWRKGSICHACADHRFGRAIWKGCGLRGGWVTEAMIAARVMALAVAWQKNAYLSADAVLTAGRVFRDRLVGAGFASDRIRVGIFPHEVSGMPTQWEPAPLKDGPPVFIFYGSELLVKGQALLLDAVRYLSHRCVILLHVLMPSNELVRLVSAASAANPLVEVILDSEARWDTGVRDAVFSARAVLVPSVWESPHELVVYEAMAMGRAVVVTACSGNAELVEDGCEGFVVPADAPKYLAERLDQLSNDPMLAAEMGRRGRERYESQLIPARWGNDFVAALGIARRFAPNRDMGHKEILCTGKSPKKHSGESAPGNCDRGLPTVFVPMLSSTPDGTITAGLGVRRLLGDCGHETERETVWDNIFLTVNDGIAHSWPRWAVRWLVLHAAALADFASIKVFTSHHSPFFASGHLVVIHDVIPFRMPDRYPAQTFYTRYFLSAVMGAADAVVTISQTVKADLLELFPEVRGKVHVIPSFSAKFEKLEDCTSIEAGVDRNSRRFLMVGMTRRHKNLDWGTAAISLAAESVPGLRLDAAGVWKDFWPDVVAAAGSAESRAEIVLHEYVSDAKLDAFYCGSKALLYLSSDEGMGLPPLEALARGCPVVCSDIPIFREVCRDAAFYVPLHDTVALAGLIKRLAQGELEAEISRKLEVGRRRVAVYGAQPLASRWRELLADYARWRKPNVV